MKRLPAVTVVAFPLALVLLVGAVGLSQPPSPAAAAPADKGKMLLTIFLKHDQSKTLGQIQQELQATGFAQKFPPPGVEVVSWYVMMGIGQVVTLRFPAERLREVNLAVEQSAWGAFRTEFYPTYDFRPVAEAERKQPAKQ
jgi:hypothetical protein